MGLRGIYFWGACWEEEGEPAWPWAGVMINSSDEIEPADWLCSHIGGPREPQWVPTDQPRVTGHGDPGYYDGDTLAYAKARDDFLARYFGARLYVHRHCTWTAPMGLVAVQSTHVEVAPGEARRPDQPPVQPAWYAASRSSPRSPAYQSPRSGSAGGCVRCTDDSPRRTEVGQERTDGWDAIAQRAGGTVTIDSSEQLTAGRVAAYVAERRYARKDGWVVVEELVVPGAHTERRLDLFAIGRKGRAAVEVKVARSDWLNELDQPAKRAPAEKYAHRCWFAVTPGVAEVSEVPDGWGLLEVQRNRVLRRRAAPPRTPEPLPDVVIARIARRAESTVPPAEERGLPLRLPLKAWEHAGRALSGEELVALAVEMYGASVDAAAKSRVRAAEWQAQANHQTWTETSGRNERIVATLLSVLGLPADANELEIQVAMGRDMAQHRDRVVATLQRLHDQLGRTLDSTT